jgi:hypothetical protein
MQDFTTALKSQDKGPRTAAALPHKEHPAEQNIVNNETMATTLFL